jgi:hypothetical protein
MKSLFSLAGLLFVLAIGFYIYKMQIQQGQVNGEPITQQISTAAIKTDLLSLGKAEKLYLAINGRYGTIGQLKKSGVMSSIPEGWQGYVYEAEVEGAEHFRIVARPLNPDLPAFSVDETMDISQR